MFLFIMGCILLVLSLGAGTMRIHAKRLAEKWQKKVDSVDQTTPYGKEEQWQSKVDESENLVKGWNALYLFLVILGVFLVGLACFTITAPRSVKVPVTVGTVGTPMKSGPHFKYPITKVVKIDTVEQQDNWNNGKNEETDHGTISVQLGDGSLADAYVGLTWEINGDAASEVYSKYRADDPTEKVYERLIAPGLKQSAQEVLGTYDPTKPTSETATTVSFAPDFDTLSDKIRENFEARVNKRGDFIKVIEVNHSKLGLAPETQKRINQYRDEILKTKTAGQAVLTATEQAKANKILAESLKSDEGTAAYCFSLIEKGFKPPVGFSCYPGSGGSNLILPGGTTR